MNENTKPAENPMAGIFTPAAGTGAPAGSVITPVPSPVATAATSAISAISAKRANRTETRGRHPKGCTCGNCSQSKTPGSANTAKAAKQAASAANVVSAQDVELGRQAILAGTRLMDSFGLIIIAMALKKKGATPELIDESTEKVAMTKETREGIAESGSVVLQKYNALKFAPEVALGLYMTSWLTGIFSLLFKIMKTPDKEETVKTSE